ncbi:phage tail tape measure protein [Streptomyces xanthophaeus]|uniref:phage tail tape measure protein n=1 Tax=Streptomyces xanthophaeus TaxID=67385 RepID=UPI00386E97EB|nr:phage tail tape measure protein [Streptomyces xanthophaeus]WST62139.1 phage tail tape measure protein [Streptomyces xanthophaeus]
MAVLSELLVKLGIDAQELTNGAEGAAQDVNNSLMGIGGMAAGAAVGGMFAVGLASAMDASSANAQLTAQLGLTEAEAERAGDVAGEVFNAGFGESIAEVNEGIGAVASALGGMSEIGTAELEDMTRAGLALAKTFEIDVAEASTAAGVMINTGLVKDGTEAFDVLTKAAQTLPKSMMADIPATVTEYGKHWSRIGLDAKDAMGMMSQYVQAGGRDIDQAGDVLHEFARITSEETDKASEAFKGLGLPAKQMLADIHKGGEPAKAALQKTIEALRGVKDEGKQSALAVELFGDMAGEGADALWAMDPATAAAKTGMADAAGAAKSMQDALAADPMMAYDSIVRSLSSSLGELLGPALTTVAGFAKEHPEAFKAIAAALGIFAVAMAIAAAAQWAMNSAMLANPVTWIILAVVALIAVIVLVATKTEWFQTAWKWMTDEVGKAWDWLWGKVSTGLSDLANFMMTWTGAKWIMQHWQQIKDAVGAAVAWVTDTVEAGSRGVTAAIDWLQALPGRVRQYFGDMAMQAGLKITALVDWVRGIPERVKSAVGDLGRLLLGAGRSIIQGLIDGVNGMVGSLRNKFSSITGMIPDWKGPMSLDMRLLTPSGEALMDGLMDGVQGGVPDLRRTLQGITSEIPHNVSVGVSRAGASGGGRQEVVARLVIDSTADSAFATAIKRVVRIDGGDENYFGQD